jgi:hypothetical protein
MDGWSLELLHTMYSFKLLSDALHTAAWYAADSRIETEPNLNGPNERIGGSDQLENSANLGEVDEQDVIPQTDQKLYQTVTDWSDSGTCPVEKGIAKARAYYAAAAAKTVSTL